MSSDTDQPRQRTVAELLAEHGGATATGGRRRRRGPAGPDEVASPPRGNPAAARRDEPRRDEPRRDGPRSDAPPLDVQPSDAGLRYPAPYEPRDGRVAPRRDGPRYAEGFAAARVGSARVDEDQFDEQPPEPPPHLDRPSRPAAAMPRRQDLDARRARPPVAFDGRPAERDTSTDRMPHYREDVSERPARPLIGRPDNGNGRVEPEGFAPARGRRRAGGLDDGGPATQAGGPIDFDDRPAGLGERPKADRGYDADDEDHDDYDGSDELAHLRDPDLDDDPNGDEKPRRRRAAADVDDPPGQSWPAVVAQWITGAVVGAALWVGFRFLWGYLPVVAIAAAVLVTVGLVLLVRNLLHTRDLRTTIFAVAVGLLLTVSPVLLILMGR